MNSKRERQILQASAWPACKNVPVDGRVPREPHNDWLIIVCVSPTRPLDASPSSSCSFSAPLGETITRWPRDKLLVHGVQWHPEPRYRRRKKKVCAWWIPIGCVMNSFESSKRRKDAKKEGGSHAFNERAFNLRLGGGEGASIFVVSNFLPRTRF